MLLKSFLGNKRCWGYEDNCEKEHYKRSIKCTTPGWYVVSITYLIKLYTFQLT